MISKLAELVEFARKRSFGSFDLQTRYSKSAIRRVRALLGLLLTKPFYSPCLRHSDCGSREIQQQNSAAIFSNCTIRSSVMWLRGSPRIWITSVVSLFVAARTGPQFANSARLRPLDRPGLGSILRQRHVDAVPMIVFQEQLNDPHFRTQSEFTRGTHDPSSRRTAIFFGGRRRGRRLKFVSTLRYRN